MICTKHIQVEDSGRKYKPQVLDDAQSWQTIDASALTDDSPFNTEKRRLTRKLGNQINTALLFKLLLYIIKNLLVHWSQKVSSARKRKCPLILLYPHHFTLPLDQVLHVNVMQN